MTMKTLPPVKTTGPIWRKVTRTETRWAGRNGSLTVYLGCGHVLRRKASEGAGWRARCQECEHLRDRLRHGGSEQWDPVAMMPVIANRAAE